MNEIKFNGKPVENPVARAAVAGLAVLISVGVMAFVLFVVLPFLGLVLSGTLAIVLLIVVASIPLALIKKASGKARS